MGELCLAGIWLDQSAKLAGGTIRDIGHRLRQGRPDRASPTIARSHCHGEMGTERRPGVVAVEDSSRQRL